MDLSYVVIYLLWSGHRPRDLWLLVDDSEHTFELHPIMQAILQESISMLEIALSKSPEAVRESIGPVTTVELCVHWPEGLRKLLSTEAVDILDEHQCVEVIRLLTFEALEMTHTCCEFTVVDRPDVSSEEFDVLMNCKPERWQKIRSDKREQENATLLETLMDEFIGYMLSMESCPRSLEIFVHGYWRQRISEVYAVDLNEIKDIRECLIGTKTYVLPDRIRPLLRKDFKLIEPQNLKSTLTPGRETSHEEKVELDDESFKLLPCRWCCLKSADRT
ncbi:hypothetical protein FDENT_2437 [Fusarium denticulatum]|uniref:Uncharacterized protein n=1 Tax=Fusarium denticulatum TaxID=48507 RepID=A0A8H6CUY4_9HYPO|nr:hypothetical protein FDENT_2437 [Fusarium denticulatum]